MMVVDASVVVDLLLNTPRGAVAAEHLAHEQRGLAAPHLIDVEVGHALRRLVMAGRIPPQVVNEALAHLQELPLTRYPHGPLLSRAHQLRDNVTTYDAMYLVLAEALDAPLLTADGALANISGCDAEVRLVDAR